MRSPFRALLWEQSRVAGVLSLWIIGLRLLLLPFHLFLKDRNSYNLDDFNAFFILILLLTHILCLTYRRDANGHLTGGFEKRLMRLPLRTPLLALTILYIRLFFFCITLVALLLFNTSLFAVNVPYFDWIVMLELYLIFQTVDWIRHAIRGLSWIPLLFLVALVFIPTLNWEEGAFGVFLGTLTQEIVSPGFLLFTLLAATLLSWLSVNILRRGACYGIPGPLMLIQQLREMGKARTQAFSSPAEALLWYEWKRHGWKLPVRMLFVCVVLYLLYFAFCYPSEEKSDFFTIAFSVYTIPLIALLLITPFTGWLTTGFRFILRRPQSQFPHMRPVTPLDHAWAKWLMLLKSLLLATAIAGCLSLIGTIAFAPSNIHVLWTSLQKGENSLFEVIIISSAPLLFFLALAWLLYFKETAAILLICVLNANLYFTMNFDILHTYEFVYKELDFHTYQALILLSGLFSYAAIAQYRKQVSWRWTVSLLLLWGLLSQQVLSISTDLRFLNRFSLMVVGYIGLIFIPFFSPFLDSSKAVQSQDRKKMWRREFRRPGFLLPITMLLLCLGLSFFVLSHPPAAHKKLKEDGYPITCEELDAIYATVPEEENAAPYYLAAGSKKQETLDWQLEDELPIVGDAEITESIEEIFSEEMRTAIQHYLEENQQTLALLRKARNYPKSRYPSTYIEGFFGYKSGFVDGGRLSDLLVIEAFWWTLNNQPQKVLDSLQTLSHLAQSFKSQPTCYAQSKRIRISNEINTIIQYLLIHKKLSDNTLSALEQLIDSQENSPEYFVRALKGEVALIIENYSTMLRKNSLFHLFCCRLTGLERLAQTLATHQMRKKLQAYQESLEAVRAFWDSTRYRDENPLIDYLVENQTGFMYFFDIGEAMTEQNLVKTALAIERFKLSKQRLPAQLTELLPNYLKKIPWDYLGNAPVCYQKTEKGYLVYGAGNNGKDDKALWLPEHRQYIDQVFKVERTVRVAE